MDAQHVFNWNHQSPSKTKLSLEIISGTKILDMIQISHRLCESQQISRTIKSQKKVNSTKKGHKQFAMQSKIPDPVQNTPLRSGNLKKDEGSDIGGQTSNLGSSNLPQQQIQSNEGNVPSAGQDQPGLFSQVKEHILHPEKIVEHNPTKHVQHSEKIVDHRPVTHVQHAQKIVEHQPVQHIEHPKAVVEHQPVEHLEHPKKVVEHQPVEHIQRAPEIIEHQPLEHVERPAKIIEHQPVQHVQLPEKIVAHQPAPKHVQLPEQVIGHQPLQEHTYVRSGSPTKREEKIEENRVLAKDEVPIRESKLEESITQSDRLPQHQLQVEETRSRVTNQQPIRELKTEEFHTRALGDEPKRQLHVQEHHTKAGGLPSREVRVEESYIQSPLGMKPEVQVVREGEVLESQLPRKEPLQQQPQQQPSALESIGSKIGGTVEAIGDKLKSTLQANKPTKKAAMQPQPQPQPLPQPQLQSQMQPQVSSNAQMLKCSPFNTRTFLILFFCNLFPSTLIHMTRLFCVCCIIKDCRGGTHCVAPSERHSNFSCNQLHSSLQRDVLR
jgi:hypothetical protein